MDEQEIRAVALQAATTLVAGYMTDAVRLPGESIEAAADKRVDRLLEKYRRYIEGTNNQKE
jgi:hypothetical protein